MNSKGYIDIHSHILYSIDDGAGTIEESVKIVKVLVDMGFSASYATPHNIPRNDRDDLIQRIEDRAMQISRALESEGVAYKIHTGAENYFDVSLNIKNPESYFIPLGNSDVFLVEIPFIGEISHHITALRRTGLKCIIAHVERYMDIVQSPDKASLLKEAGFLLQMNIGSIIGVYGIDVMKTANRLLETDIIDAIATDIHDLNHANIVLKKGLKRLETLTPHEQLTRILKNTPYDILHARTPA